MKLHLLSLFVFGFSSVAGMAPEGAVYADKRAPAAREKLNEPVAFAAAVHTTRDFGPQPVRARKAIVINGASNTDHANGGWLPGSFGNPTFSFYLWNELAIPVTTNAIGGTLMWDMVGRALVLELEPLSNGDPVRANWWISRRQREESRRSTWLSYACQFADVKWVGFYRNGVLQRVVTEPTTRVCTTVHASHPTRIYCDTEGLSVGQIVRFDSPDLPALPEDLTRRRPDDRTSNSAEGNNTRDGMPVDLVWMHPYAIKTVESDYIEVTDYNQTSATTGDVIEIGSDATIALRMVEGWDGPEYDGTGDWTIKVRHQRDDWIQLTYGGNNDLFHLYKDTVDWEVKFLNALSPLEKKHLMMLPHTSMGPFAIPGGIYLQEVESMIDRAEQVFGDNAWNFGALKVADDQRLATELALLDDPEVPQLMALDVNAPPDNPVKLADYAGALYQGVTYPATLQGLQDLEAAVYAEETTMSNRSRAIRQAVIDGGPDLSGEAGFNPRRSWQWVGPGYPALQFASDSYDRSHGNMLFRQYQRNLIIAKLLDLGWIDPEDHTPENAKLINASDYPDIYKEEPTFF